MLNKKIKRKDKTCCNKSSYEFFESILWQIRYEDTNLKNYLQ